MSFAAVATKLISKNGRPMALRTLTTSGTVYDPTVTAVDIAIVGVMTNYKLSDIRDTVQVGDKMVIVDSSVVPTPDMRLVDSGTEYEIIDVIEIKPGTESIMFKLQVRR